MNKLFNSKLLLNISILIVLFFLSIVIRFDNLKDPMGRHHEWLTGHVLSTIYTLDKDGAASHYFSPTWTFNTEADRYVQSFSTFKDKNNFTYYVSYPPMCFLLPHFLLKLTGGSSLIGIRVIGLIIQFFTGIFIFLIVHSLFKRKIRQDFFIPSFAAFFLYTFASGNLWFHGHIFFADMIVPLFITGFLWALLKTLNNEWNIKKSLIILAVFTFLGAYTEWQMLFLVFFAGIFFAIKGFKEKKYFLYFFVLGFTACLAVFLTYFQYSLIAGFDELVKVVQAKYTQRSGADASAEAGLSMKNSFSFINISDHYERNFSTLLDYAWYCLLLFASCLAINKFLGGEKIGRKPFLIMGLVLLSILTHHYVFFNFTTVHDFSTLKTALLLTLISGVAIGYFYVSFIDNKSKHLVYGALLLITLSIYFHFSTKEYYRVNSPRLLTNFHPMVGAIVKKHVNENEILVCSGTVTPETSWYAKRNILIANSLPEALFYLKQINSKLNGTFIKMNVEDYEIYKFNTNGDTLSYYKEGFGNVNLDN